MTLSSWIAGLMRENYEEVGFLPESAIENQYIKQGNYVLQKDATGNNIGYLIHGPVANGKKCYISQHCIQYEKRLRGFGKEAFNTVMERCEKMGTSSIHLRCATDLEAIEFWKKCGFEIYMMMNGGSKRKRKIAKMILKLDLPLDLWIPAKNMRE